MCVLPTCELGPRSCSKSYLPLAGSEGMEKTTETTTMGDIGLGLDNENYYNGLNRDYYKDPFLHSWLTKGNLCITPFSILLSI